MSGHLEALAGIGDIRTVDLQDGEVLIEALIAASSRLAATGAAS
jgi:hypothetical protein